MRCFSNNALFRFPFFVSFLLLLNLSNSALAIHVFLTHVQYTQTDTIHQTDGPLIPMVGLVPIEKDVIPMVLLVDMHLIKGTLIIL